MMARAVIRKSETPWFVLNSQVRVADWDRFAEPIKASGKYQSRDQRPDTGLY
ncbi:MAG: hypothetical protein WBV71_03400 [Roseobacter sp.]